MDMLIGGKHISSEDLEEVINPYNGEVIDTIPIAHRQIADMAIEAANDAKSALTEMSAFKISNKLFNVVDKLREKRQEFAELLTLEVGKPINESLVEVDRSIETLKLAAEEAKRIYGESVPLDAGLNGKGFFAFLFFLCGGIQNNILLLHTLLEEIWRILAQVGWLNWRLGGNFGGTRATAEGARDGVFFFVFGIGRGGNNWRLRRIKSVTSVWRKSIRLFDT